MDIKQLKYFLTIAEEEQITSAAKKLNMSQPPLSYQLKTLEDELGVRLVDRGSKKIHLTDAGQVLRNRAEQIVELTEVTYKELRDLSKGMQGTLSIGTVSSSGPTLFDKRLKIFHDVYPLVNFEIYEGNTYKIIEYLHRGLIQIGIVRTPFNMDGFNYILADPEPMVAVMSESLDWDNKNEKISLLELKDKPLIVYRRFEALIKERCESAGFEPKFFCKNDDARTTLLWAASGLGIGIVPYSAINLVPNNNLKLKIIDDSFLKSQIAAIWLKDKYISTSAKHFLDIFRG